MYNYIKDNDLITVKQSGFRPGDSTVCQLSELYHMFCNALDNKKEVRVVFCDISKAFDRVWHEGLLHKLKKIGISGIVLDWFQSYLSNRKQRVVINGECSNWGKIRAGVPQGSILEPLLFLIYINDITEVVNSEIRLYADDTTLYITVDNPDSAAASLNEDLENMSLWANKWLITFSPRKTKSMTLSLKLNKPVHPPLIMGEVQLEEVKSFKHLGLTLQNDLLWESHINNIGNSAERLINVLSALKYKLDRKSLEIMYLSFIRPKLEYASIIWDNCNITQSDKLEHIQLRAARIVAGGMIRTSYDQLLIELGWQTLKSRRYISRLVMLHKIKLGQSPNYMKEILPGTVSERTGLNLRNADDVRGIHANTDRFKNSFYPQTIDDYNNLPPHIQSAESINSFKLLLKPKTKKKSWYYVGDRKESIIQAQIRMNCSPLKIHLHSLNIIPECKCECGYVRETTYHYILECPLYYLERTTMMNSLIDICPTITVDVLSFGDESLTEDLNNNIMLIVQRFIKESKRFGRN